MIKYSIRPCLFVIGDSLLGMVGTLVFALAISSNVLKDGAYQHFSIKRLGEQLMDANF